VHSTADWSSPAFLDEATDWIDEQLLAHGLERTGRVEQPHLRPWATALRAETTGGPVWLKAPGTGTVCEVPLYVEMPNGWLTGPLESAASVLDEDYLGGA
jgi:hypothetical protein